MRPQIWGLPEGSPSAEFLPFPSGGEVSESLAADICCSPASRRKSDACGGGKEEEEAGSPAAASSAESLKGRTALQKRASGNERERDALCFGCLAGLAGEGERKRVTSWALQRNEGAEGQGEGARIPRWGGFSSGVDPPVVRVASRALLRCSGFPLLSQALNLLPETGPGRLQLSTWWWRSALCVCSEMRLGFGFVQCVSAAEAQARLFLYLFCGILYLYSGPVLYFICTLAIIESGGIYEAALYHRSSKVSG